ncbi:MAG: hypothetical protein WAW57_10595 [Lutibacter sp.]
MISDFGIGSQLCEWNAVECGNLFYLSPPLKGGKKAKELYNLKKAPEKIVLPLGLG